MVVRVGVVCPGDCAADRELQLSALPSITREDWAVAAQKRFTFKIRSTVSTECRLLLNHHQVEKSQVKSSEVRDCLY